MKHVSEREGQLPYGVIHNLLKIAVEDKTIISLGPGEPDFPAPPDIVKYTKQIAPYVNHYSPPAGRSELKEAILKKIRKHNKIKAGIENVLPTTGSQEGLMLAMMCSMDATEQIIIPSPGFLGYTPAAELVDAVPMPLQLREDNRFEPDPDDIKKIITGKTSAILINTPANPTGSVIRKKTLEEIAQVAVDYDLYVFSDEAYEHIIYDRAKHVSIGSLNGMQDYVVSLFTFSKSYAMCGYRVGYAVGPEDLIEAMARSHTYTTLATPTISQILAVKALKMPMKYTNKMVREYKRRRDMLVKQLNEMGFATHMPQGAFYAFSNIQNFDSSSKRFAQALLEKAKVAVVPGVEFGAYGEGFVRFSFATKYELIKEALDRIENFLKKY